MLPEPHILSRESPSQVPLPLCTHTVSASAQVKELANALSELKYCPEELPD
jgi:hypothetical protein